MHDPQGWVSDVRCGHISHHCAYVLSSTLSIYSTSIAIVWRVYDAASIHSLIFIYSMMGLLIYKYEPFWQEVVVKSLILRWPVRPVGLFLKKIIKHKTNTTCNSVWNYFLSLWESIGPCEQPSLTERIFKAKIFIRTILCFEIEKSLWFIIKCVILNQTQLLNFKNITFRINVHWVNEWLWRMLNNIYYVPDKKNSLYHVYIVFMNLRFGDEKKDKICS